MLIFLYIALCLLVTSYQLCYTFNNLFSVTRIGNCLLYISIALIIPIVAIGGWLHILWYLIAHIATYFIALLPCGLIYRWYYNKRFCSAASNGNQIHKFNKNTAILFLCILLTASVAINAYMAYSNSILQENIETLNQAVENKTALFNSANSNYIDLRSEYIDIKADLSFYEKHVVIVPNDNKNTYHIYGCKYCDTTNGFWAYNLEAAIGKDCSPCKYCCK